ncbi:MULTISPECIES: hypothetical protein [unclassified Streptomyces]|uniref:hypothetical protein n=1 Tax=unclassified Streptomyces TaxID=2593676 RepID=UPI0014891646|nr:MULTISPECIES: hypothetical protein [unclassified Streptomyces]
MTGPDRMTLIELAETAYSECLGATQDEADERHQEHVEDFLTSARGAARHRLGSAADELDWTYTSPDDLPDDVEEATALLAKGRMDWLRYRYDHATERTTFELVKQCSTCSHEQADEVDGLVKLGELLAAKGGDR